MKLEKFPTVQLHWNYQHFLLGFDFMLYIIFSYCLWLVHPVLMGQQQLFFSLLCLLKWDVLNL